MACVLDYLVPEVLGGGGSGGPAAQAVGDAWKAYIVPNMLDNYTYEGIQWVTLDNADGDTGFYPPSVGGSNAGSGSNQASQPATAVLVKKTGSGGRGTRQGRMYLPPPGEAQVDENGFLDPAQRDNYQVAVRRFLHMSEAGTGEPAYQMAVSHFDEPRPPKGTDDNRVGFSTQVIDLFVEPQVATQRRRLR
jgi:hypothetical protein